MKMKPLPSRLALLLLAAAAAARADVEFAYDFSPGAVIPDLDQYVDTRVIANPGFASITGVTLDLSLAAAPGEAMWLGDLYATLTHGTALESERVAVLLNRPGRDATAPFGSELGLLSVTLDDAAVNPIFNVTVPSGSYRPDGRLSVDPYAAPVAFVAGSQTLGQLDGTWLASNRWSLLLADTTAGDTARLESWTLRISGAQAAGVPLVVGAATATFDSAPAGPVQISAGGTARFLAGSTELVTLGAGAVAEFSGTVTGQIDTSGGGTVRLLPGSVLSPAFFNLGPTATLAGSGTVSSPTTIEGMLSPGQSPGILTFEAGLALTGASTTTFELGGLVRGVEHDGIDLVSTGLLSYGGELSLVFPGPVVLGVYDLFDIGGAVTSGGDFSEVNLIGGFTGPAQVAFFAGAGWSARIDDYQLEFSNASGDLSISLIPEPAFAGVAVGLLALGLGLVRRRSR